MTETNDTLTSEVARCDLQNRLAQQAGHCVRFAVVTSEAVAAELIDKAIQLHAAADQPRTALAA